MKVLKFGGSTLTSVEAVKNNIAEIKSILSEHTVPAIIFSAFYGMTDKLLNTSSLAAAYNEDYTDALEEIEKYHISLVQALIPAQEQSHVLANVKMMINDLDDVLRGVYLLKERSERTKDLILSFGECLSCYILTEIFKSEGVAADFVDARKLVLTNDNFGSARVDFEKTYENIRQHFAQVDKLQVVTGFIAATAQGETTTLGRDGSDFTASIFGAALDADEVEIWTNVDGMMTGDPRSIEDAFPIDSMTYEEAMEMSHSGARVIYPPTIQPVRDKKIPMRIKNAFNLDFEGTVIGEKQQGNHNYLIKGISSIDSITLIRIQGSGMVGIPGIARRLFTAISSRNINVILISQTSSEHSICVAVRPQHADAARECIEEEFTREISRQEIDGVIVEPNHAVLSIVGENMRKSPIITSSIFSALEQDGVDVVAIAQGSSELNISVVVRQEDEKKALRSVHRYFFTPGKRTVHLFVVGTGLIGGQLLDQIAEQRATLAEDYGLDLRVAGLANSKNMLCCKREGISLSNWREQLDAGDAADMPALIERMKALKVSGAIFIDCTASQKITEYYEEILKARISIVTPNKKANSSHYDSYLNLKKTAQHYGVNFMYETNVGAGLPIIGTLNDLLQSGDAIVKIEAILSGTLSYIFNTFDGSQPFSQVVRQAKEKGYTEPDPRDDLNGMDVARKILILARESGLALELSDVEVEPFLPEAAFKASSIDAFFEELEKGDADFAQKIEVARTNNKALRYIATFADGKARVALTEIDQNHAFYTLSGSDNIVSFTTSRYTPDTPLVVKGPGAGAAVTAGGVFADIIKSSRHA